MTAPVQIVALGWRLIIGFALSMFTVGAFFLSLSPALFEMSKDLNAPPHLLGLPGALYGLSLGATALSASMVMDRYDRRRFFHGGMTLHVLGIALVVATPGWAMFCLGWTLCGSGAGLLQPAAYAIVSDATSEKRRARSLGHINVGWAAATLIGVPAMAGLQEWLGWRLSLSLFLLSWATVRVLTTSRLLARRTQELTPSNRSSLWSRDRLHAIAKHRLHWLFLTTILIFVGFYGAYTFLGLALVAKLGSPPSTIGGFVGIYGVGFLAGTLNTWVIDRLGRLRVLTVSTSALGVLLVAMPRLLLDNGSVSLCMFAWGILQVFTFTSLTSIAGCAPKELRGLALALNSAAVMAGAALGSALMGPIFNTAGYQVVGLLSGGATLLAAAIAASRVRRLPDVHP